MSETSTAQTTAADGGSRRIDVIVVGGGGAGLAAAVTAAELGAAVIVFEAESELGGSTKLSSGLFSAGGTSVQSALGVTDSADLFYQHYMDLNQWRVQNGRIRSFCIEAAGTFEWLLGLGVQVPAAISYNARQPGLNQAGVSDVWRAHVPLGEGAGVVRALTAAIEATGIEVAVNSRVQSLVVDDDGVVRGVRVNGTEYLSSAVIVTTGGISHDTELLSIHYPRALQSPNLFRVAAPGSRGDHMRFAEAVGASIEGDDRGLLLLAADFQTHHHWTAGFPPTSRIYLDHRGRRFTNEDVSYSVSTGIFDRAGGWAWALFDEAARLSLPHAGGEFLDWTAENVAEQAAGGETAVIAETITELAELIGLPVTAVRQSIDDWNSEMPAGRPDSTYFRHLTLAGKGSTADPKPLETAPFYAVRMRPSELICTHVGLEINERAEVLSTDGTVIDGLFAGGEAGGGILGESYVGGGNSVANALTMGRVAGRTAATRALGVTPASLRHPL